MYIWGLPRTSAPHMLSAAKALGTLCLRKSVWYGAVAQLIERRIRIAEARGLNPLSSTK